MMGSNCCSDYTLIERSFLVAWCADDWVQFDNSIRENSGGESPERSCTIRKPLLRVSPPITTICIFYNKNVGAGPEFLKQLP